MRLHRTRSGHDDERSSGGVAAPLLVVAGACLLVTCGTLALTGSAHGRAQENDVPSSVSSAGDLPDPATSGTLAAASGTPSTPPAPRTKAPTGPTPAARTRTPTPAATTPAAKAPPAENWPTSPSAIRSMASEASKFIVPLGG